MGLETMDLATLIDHTLLRANAKEEEIRKLCQEAKEYNFYSVCVNPRWIPLCKKELRDSNSFTIPITVVGFPLGANTLSMKEKECEESLEEGAKEIDMVIDLQNALAHDWKKVEEEIKALIKICKKIPLKVIIETAYLSKDEIKEASKCCLWAGAAFVKTSTGFAPSGAKEEDIRIIKEIVHPNLGIKASGGIKTLADAEAMLRAGATRLGCSASVALVNEWKNRK